MWGGDSHVEQKRMKTLTAISIFRTTALIWTPMRLKHSNNSPKSRLKIHVLVDSCDKYGKQALVLGVWSGCVFGKPGVVFRRAQGHMLGGTCSFHGTQGANGANVQQDTQWDIYKIREGEWQHTCRLHLRLFVQTYALPCPVIAECSGPPLASTKVPENHPVIGLGAHEKAVFLRRISRRCYQLCSLCASICILPSGNHVQNSALPPLKNQNRNKEWIKRMEIESLRKCWICKE